MSQDRTGPLLVVVWSFCLIKATSQEQPVCYQSICTIDRQHTGTSGQTTRCLLKTAVKLPDAVAGVPSVARNAHATLFKASYLLLIGACNGSAVNRHTIEGSRPRMRTVERIGAVIRNFPVPQVDHYDDWSAMIPESAWPLDRCALACLLSSWQNKQHRRLVCGPMAN